MNVDNFINDFINDLNLVAENNKLEFLKNRMGTVEDLRYKETIEITILNYISTGILDTFKRPKTLCISLHGIKTHGKWGYELKSLLEAQYNIDTAILSFGFKDPFSFIFPYVFKRRNIRYIEDQLKTLISKNEHTILVLVAHSFGTYIMSKIIEDNQNIKFDRIIYCGSVVLEKFPWEKKLNFPKGGLINDCGVKDIWPVMAKAFGTDYGDSGRSGFTCFDVKNRYHECDHGGFFSKNFMERFWLPFIADGKVIKSDVDVTESWWLSVISLFKGQLLWVIILSSVLISITKYKSFFI